MGDRQARLFYEEGIIMRQTECGDKTLNEAKDNNTASEQALRSDAFSKDAANIAKQADSNTRQACGNLPQLSVVGDNKQNASKPKVIEVPPSDELDSPEWHKHHTPEKGAPGEYVPAVTPHQPPDSRVVAALEAIRPDIMKQRMEELSGHKEVTINGQTDKIESRSTFGDGYDKALNYLKEKFEKDGYKVVIDTYSRHGETYHNLRAMRLGQTKPDEVVMFGAHIDSTAGYPWGFEPKAPGADDDLSGAVGATEIAHAIKDMPLDRTVVFSLFSGEEEGLWGSRAMAELYKQAQTESKQGVDHSKDGLGKIVAMYQMDMIGYSPSSKTIESHDTTSDAGAHNLTNVLAAAQQRYNIDLKVYGAHNEELTNRSDHYPFYKNGSPAVLVIEPYDTAGDNFNPNYHSTNDTIDKVNLPYMTNVTKLVLAAGVEMAGLRDK
jgi:hypothetical protein